MVKYREEDAVSPAVAVVLIAALSVVLVAGVSATLVGMTSNAADTAMSFNMTDILIDNDMGWVIGIFPEEEVPEIIKVTHIDNENNTIRLKNIGYDIEEANNKGLRIYFNDKLHVTTKIGRDITEDINYVSYTIEIHNFDDAHNIWPNQKYSTITIKSGINPGKGTRICVELIDKNTDEVLSRSEYVCP